VKKNILIAACLLVIILSSAIAFIILTTPSPAPDAIVLKPYNSLQNAVQGLVNGEVDLLPIDKIDLQTLKPLQNNPQIQLISIPTFDFTYIGLNQRNWPLSDVNLRRAMLYGFNRHAALSQVLGGYGESLHPGLLSSAYSASGWLVNTNDPYGYTTARARALLNSEGFNASTSGRFRLDPQTGQTLRTMFIYSRLGQPADVAAADLFAKDMQAIGLPIISLPMSDLDFKLAMHTYAFDIFIDSQASDSAPTWLFNLFFGLNDLSPVPLGTNLFGYTNPAFDSYLSDFLAPPDQQTARTAVDMCEQILVSDLPVLPVFSENLLMAANSRLPVSAVVGSLENSVRMTALAIVQNSTFPLPLRIGFSSSFSSLDPTTTSNTADWTALNLITEPLATLNQNGVLKPDLAQQWAISQGYTDASYFITLTLRQNAKFYNGQTITPDDVVATLNWLMKNVRASSPIYPIVSEIAAAEVQNKKVLVTLTVPDPYAIYSFTQLFALPKSRLPSDSSSSDFLRDQVLVSSGPFNLREFTQSGGVYLQRNSAYFGQSVHIENIDAFEGEGVLPTGSVQISSSSLMIGGQPIQNASFRVCIYDNNDTAMECSTGTYAGNGVYSASPQIDSRFRAGQYRLESSLYATMPTGVFLIVNQTTLTLISLPLILLLIFVALILAIAVFKRQEVAVLLGMRKAKRRRVTRKKAVRRRRRSHQSVRRAHPRT
jgi:ABC-type transport system substrate-binding protein